jgi:hypothetical protein
MPGREAIELESEMNHFSAAAAVQRMAESETGGGNFPRKRLVEAQRDHRTLAALHFDQAEREAGWFLRDEVHHELTVDRQCEERRADGVHGVAT